MPLARSGSRLDRAPRLLSCQARLQYRNVLTSETRMYRDGSMTGKDYPVGIAPTLRSLFAAAYALILEAAILELLPSLR
jgi:hypothetical protein